jgi:neutral amino acid transport system ATP-binding protein
VSTLLEVREVTRSFGGVRAVDGVSFDVVAGSITALIGPNGAGKSSLFNIISGFLRPEQGTVRFSGSAIQRRPPHRIARAGLVRTFQTPRALTKMSVLENVLLAAPHHGGERRGGCWHSSVSIIRRTPTRARSPAASGSCSTSHAS